MSLVDTTWSNSARIPLTGLFLRKISVFYTATVLFADYKICQWRCNQLPLSDEVGRDAIWSETHTRNSKFVMNQFISLEGLWVKLGQYLSSRADIMPEEYLRELSRCQDSLPARPFVDIKNLVEAELGKPLHLIFHHVEEKPIACASIAQVHRAKLTNGRDVVIKVQHAQVGERLLQDLKNLETIGDTMKRLDPDFDFSPVIREWAKEVPKELDFRQEAYNMQQVERNLASMLPRGANQDPSLTIDVSFPQVIEGLVSEKVLVMSYIDGFKIDNKELLEQHQADKASLVQNVTKAFAQQIFVDGFYTADPHPGNLLVDLVTLKPVLLDFGLTKEIDDDVRYNFAKLLVAVAEQDIHGLISALDGVGLKLRIDVPFDVSLLAKYFFRDARKQEEARKESAKRREEWKKKAEEHKKSVYVGDKVDVTTTTMFCIRSIRKGEVVGIRTPASHHRQGKSGPLVTVRLTDGSEVEVDRDSVAVQRSRSPIDAWPDSFIFFDRVLGLLRGLTASLDVSQSYIEVMTPFARKSLLDFDAKRRLTRRLTTIGSATSGSISATLPDVRGLDNLGGMAEILQELVTSGDVLGCQVCVIEDGQVVVELAAGVLSPYDLIPVGQDSLFSCFSVTKGVTAAAIHLLSERGLVDFQAPVCQYWPEFATNGKRDITVAHVLQHQAGLSNAALEDIAEDPFVASDEAKMLDILAVAEPDALPGTETRYHYLTFGWLCDGIVRGATGGMKLRSLVENDIARKLNIEREFMVGLGEGGSVDPDIAPRLATLVLGKIKNLKSDFAADEKKNDKESVVENGQAVSVVDTTTTATEIESPEKEQSKPKRRPPVAPSLLMNPTFFNNPRIRETSMPAANGHFSARALAKFYSAIGNDAFVSSINAASSSQRDSQQQDARTNRNEQTAGMGSIFRSGWGEFLRPKVVKQSGSSSSAAAEVQDEVMFQGGSGQFALGYTLFPANASTVDESNGSGVKEISQERVTAMAKRFNVSEDEIRAYMARKHGTPTSPMSPSSSSKATPTTSASFSTPIMSKNNNTITTTTTTSNSSKSPQPINQTPTSNTLDSSSNNNVASGTSSGKKKTTLFHRTVRKLFKGKSSDNDDAGTSSSCVPTSDALNAVVSSPQLIRKAMISSMMTMSGKDAVSRDENKQAGEWVTFGHGGVGGSIALCSVRPDGRTVAIAVTLNRLSFDPSNTSGRLVAHVYKKYGISVPNNFR